MMPGRRRYRRLLGCRRLLGWRAGLLGWRAGLRGWLAGRLGWRCCLQRSVRLETMLEQEHVEQLELMVVLTLELVLEQVEVVMLLLLLLGLKLEEVQELRQ